MYKMRYSVESRDRIYVKDMDFCQNMVKNFLIALKNLQQMHKNSFKKGNSKNCRTNW